MKQRVAVLLFALIAVPGYQSSGLRAQSSAATAAASQTTPAGPFAMKATVTVRAGAREIPLKLEEKVAFMFIWAINNLEAACGRHVNRPCTMQELVDQPKAADGWNMNKLKFDPTKTDPNYTYTITITGSAWDVSAVPKKPGLGGFDNPRSASFFSKFYYNPNGAASSNDLELTETTIAGDGFEIEVNPFTSAASQATAAAPTPANLVTNGDFESGNTGFTTGYTYGNVSGPGAYWVGKNAVQAPGAYPDWYNGGDHTTGTGNMLVVNGANSATTPVWEEVVAVTPNTAYTFSCWGAGVDHASQSLPHLQLTINGSAVGSNDIPKNSPDNGGKWENFTFTWNSGSSTRADLALFDLNTDTTWNDFALDDISFGPHPPALPTLGREEDRGRRLVTLVAGHSGKAR